MNNKTTKGQIIHILSYDWPITTKRIHNLLKKIYSTCVTYQAVHKALSQLESDKVINRSKDGYSLNLEWVKDIHDKTEIIRVNYFSKKHSAFFDDNSIRVFTFKTWFDVEKYLYYLQKSYITKSKKTFNICAHHNHEWRPLFYARAEYNWQNKLNKMGHKVFTLVAGNNNTDKYAKIFYEKCGSRVKLNSKIAKTSEILSFGDLVIQTYIPLELQSKLNSLLKNNADHIKLIENVFEKETQIKVIINKDLSLAKEIQKQTLSYF